VGWVGLASLILLPGGSVPRGSIEWVLVKISDRQWGGF
jgi:hypothetical protein